MESSLNTACEALDALVIGEVERVWCQCVLEQGILGGCKESERLLVSFRRRMLCMSTDLCSFDV